jgi:bisphosphoglycerate-independent phosphoglycerate mutase (AlkP superfamily)
VDRHLGDLLETVEKQGGRWLVSSDHGNADDMVQVQLDGPNPTFSPEPQSISSIEP